MQSTTFELPAGKTLEREIESIEEQSYDAAIRTVIAERIVIANDPATAFVLHDVVVVTSRARLLEKLAGKGNA